MSIPPMLQMSKPSWTRDCLIDFLKLFRPNSARWWCYSVSHRWFELRLSRTETEYVMVCLFDCSHLSGPTSWSSPSLSFDLQQQPNEMDDPCRWVLTDRDFKAVGARLYWGYFPGMGKYRGWFSADVSDLEFDLTGHDE